MIQKSLGFSLIEILITLIITSVGLLAYAALQMNGLKQTNSALVRSEASILISDMADRIRANAPGALAGGYNQGGGGSSACTKNCTPYENAMIEVNEWLNMINKQLSDGTGTISCVDSDPKDGFPCSISSVHTLAITWDSDRSGEKNALIQVDVRL